MPIRQKSLRAKQVIEVLDCLPDITCPEDEETITITELLTPDEITEVTRYLNAYKPGWAKLIRRCRRQFPRKEKFPIRGILIQEAYETARAIMANNNANNSKVRKLPHRL